MGARALKTRITLNLAMLLLLGMASISLVTIMTAQRSLTRAEISKARAISGLLANSLVENSAWQTLPAPLELRAKIRASLDVTGASCLVLLDNNRKRFSFSRHPCAIEDSMAIHIENAMSEGTESVHFIGSTFGFFLGVQHEYLVIAAPLRRDGSVAAGFSLAFSLDGLYRNLMQLQQILFLYSVINVALLLFLGVYRMSRLYLQPLARLAQRAEDYKEDDEILFAVRKEDNELQRLSTSLNGLLRRLTTEKQKLRATVASLETANSELRKAQSEIVLAEKLASVGRLSAGIAHEIGNPIGIVTGYLDLLKHAEISPDEKVEFIDRAQQEIERISAIIHQLLEISRPSPGRCQSVSVHAVIENMTAGLSLQPFMSHLRLQHAFNAEADTVAIDSNQLRQVFLNLIINAADAVSTRSPDPRGELIIFTENAPSAGSGSASTRNWLNIHFRDTGAGIPAEHMESIFDPFFTTKEPGKGTGLGLAVSYRIIQNAGGRLRAESTVGEGTLMTVSLPLLDGNEDGPSDQRPSDEPSAVSDRGAETEKAGR
jgi:signal transduction histidine kinase